MKHLIHCLAVAFALAAAAPSAHAEELEDFLKRSALGLTTKDDIAKEFKGVVFMGGQAIDMDRDKLLALQGQQNAMGVKPTITQFTILSKTETPVMDGNASIISVVSQVSVTIKVGDSTTTGQMISHDILVHVGDKYLIFSTIARQ